MSGRRKSEEDPFAALRDGGRRIDYMVISSPPGLPTQWIVFSKAPSHPGFAATLSGASLHRL